MIVRRPHSGTLVEVFNSVEAAQAAIRELKAVGFRDSQIQIISHPRAVNSDSDEDKEIAGGATAGAAAGLGIGAIWGLGILAGITPGVDPAIAGGAVSVVLSSAAAGAATVGTAGALIGFGVSHEHAVHHPHFLRPGHTIVTVKAGTRADIASSVLNRFNRPDRFPTQAM